MNNPSVVNGFTYSGETSDDDDDPNEAYYYADPDREPKKLINPCIRLPALDKYQPT